YVANGAVDPPHGNTITSYPLPSPGASPSSTISDAVGSEALNDVDAIAFDSSHDLWAADSAAGSVAEFTPSQLASSGSPAPHVTLALSASIPSPTALGFDSSKDLWVSNPSTNSLSEFTPSQLAGSGSPTPNVTISIGVHLYGFTFDSSGDLWVLEQGGSGPDLVEFTPSQLASSGSPTPNVTISGLGLQQISVSTLAFDSSGNLWVPSGGAIVDFTPSELASSGSPTPNVAITTGGLDLAFDSSGDLWTAANGTASLRKYAPRPLWS